MDALLTGVPSFDGMQSQRGVSLPPDVAHSGVVFDDERRDLHRLEAGCHLHAGLSCANLETGI